MISAIIALAGTLAAAARDAFISSNKTKIEQAELEIQAAEVERSTYNAILSHAHEVEKIGASIVQGEIAGESPAQRLWRPHMMYWAMGMITTIGVLGPLVEALTGLPFVSLVVASLGSVPQGFWTLLTVGMGGYVAGRSVEKTVKAMKETPINSRVGDYRSD